MSRVPPWVIDEIERMRRRRSEREQPRLQIPPPPAPDRSGDDEPHARVIIVVDPSA